jgi:glutaredoxin 3
MSQVKIYTTTYCSYCHAAKALFSELGVDFEEIVLDRDPALRAKLSAENGGWRTVPMIFIDGEFVGGFDEARGLNDRGELFPMLRG